METDSDFMKDLNSALANTNTEFLSALVKDETYLKYLRNNAWDIIPLLTPYLNSEAMTRSTALHTCCVAILGAVVKEMSPDEAALQIVGEVGKITDDTAFASFLRAFEVILPKVPKKRLSTVIWSLSAIQGFLSDVDVPENYSLTAEEQLLMDAHPSVERITDLYSEIVTFVHGFMENSNDLGRLNLQYQMPVLVKFLVDVFGKPIIFLNTEVIEGTKSKASRIGEQLLDALFSLVKDPIRLLEENPRDESLKPNHLSLAHVFYLTFEEERFVGSIPKVYDPVHVFHNSLFLVCELFESKNRILVYKDTCAVWTLRSNSTNVNQPQNPLSPEEDIKSKILAAALPFVHQHGWSKEAISAGARVIGYPDISHGMFRRGGAELVEYFQKSSNLKLNEALKKLQGDPKLPITPTEFVERAVKERLQLIVPYKAKWPQAIAIMALPPNVPNALASLLTMVDDICFYAGDLSVDFNWYVRRVALAGVYKATELYLIQDSSPENEETWKFLNRRLSEAVQVHELLLNSEVAGQVAKDTVSAAFVTARNILGVNWTR